MIKANHSVQYKACDLVEELYREFLLAGNIESGSRCNVAIKIHSS